MNTKYFVGIILTSVLMSSGQPAFFDDSNNQNMMLPPEEPHLMIKPQIDEQFLTNENVRGLIAYLNIDKKRSEKILEIVRNFQKLFETKIIALQRADLDIRELLLSNNPDLKKIESVISKKAVVLSEIELAQIKRDLDIRAELTPDEFERWKEVMLFNIKQNKSIMAKNHQLRFHEKKKKPEPPVHE